MRIGLELGGLGAPSLEGLLGSLDLAQVSSIWQHGSVVRSWLLDLVAEALADDATLKGIAPVVADSGEGRWTVREAIELGLSAPVITLSLLARLKSRGDDGFGERLWRHCATGSGVTPSSGPIPKDE